MQKWQKITYSVGMTSEEPSEKASKKEYLAQWAKDNQETIKERKRLWYLANREKALAKAAAWTEAHREKKSEYQKEWYQANKDKVKKTQKKWRETHPDAARACKKAWVTANPGKVAAIKERHQAAVEEKKRLEELSKPKPAWWQKDSEAFQAAKRAVIAARVAKEARNNLSSFTSQRDHGRGRCARPRL